MFSQFLTALVHKKLEHLKAHPDFFSMNDEKKKEVLSKLTTPETFRNYLSNISETEFISDLEKIVHYIQDEKSVQIKNNSFFKAFTEFLTHELARKIDYLDSKFYLLSKDDRTDFIEKLIKGESNLAVSLREILINFTYQQISTEVFQISAKVVDSPYIVIQTPREIDTELKKEIRTELLKRNPLTFPTFQINKKLIGGLRIFNNGETIDHSWITRVLRFTSLTTQ